VLAPSPRIQRRVMIIAARLHRRGALDDVQYVQAIGTPMAAEAVTADSAAMDSGASLEQAPMGPDTTTGAPAADSDTVSLSTPDPESP
jgi:hypothetical protein